jgi:threonyl-tRNA synthetase
MLPRPARVVRRFLFLDIFRMKVYTTFVIGKRNMEADAVSVRVHRKGNLGAKPRSEAIADILRSIKERRA